MATLGRVAPPFVAMRHFPRFIGDIYPAIKVGAAVRSNVYRHSEALPKPPRQVAPSPPRYACHLSRFNGRAYSRKGNFPRSVCSPRLCETPCGSWQSRRLEYARLCKPLRPLLRGLLRCTRNDVPTLAFPCREGGGEADG